MLNGINYGLCCINVYKTWLIIDQFLCSISTNRDVRRGRNVGQIDAKLDKSEQKKVPYTDVK